MKGLISIPGEKELEEAYFRLQSQKDLTASDIEPCELALWSQWSRFDPRLAEQLVEYFIRNWMRISPLDLRESLNAQPWPSAAGVLLEQSLKFIDRPVKRFRHWFNLVMEGIPSADGEQYFIGLRAFAGKKC